MMKNKTIQIPMLIRVEGEGGLYLKIQQNKITQLQLRIYEPPRLFEKFLEGRSYDELLDLVARICGICPVAYQMSATHAVEKIFSLDPGPWVRAMRRLFYCGEWLASHNLHIHFLAAPDFLGYASALAMAKDYPEIVKRGMRLQDLGNQLIKLFGARAVHPVGACIGGFFRAPSLAEAKALLEQLKMALVDAEQLLRWVATLPLQTSSYTSAYVALCHASEYPMNEGMIATSTGLLIKPEEFEQYFQEYQVTYSTALQCSLQGQAYLVGPLARVNLNYERLPTAVQAVIAEIGIRFPSTNVFHSIVARAIEVYYAITEAIRILAAYTVPALSHVPVSVKSGVGYACTEAPRGILWHRYELDDQGIIQAARIVAPTSQNLYRIEQDLRLSLQAYGLDKTDEALKLYSEMIIRNYDPCISCSTHFLNLQVERP